jgi:hypothetical protein
MNCTNCQISQIRNILAVLSFKYHAFNAWRWSVRRKIVASVDGTNKICCGWRQYVCHCLTLILLTWRIWWAPNNASRWQMGFNSAFKGLIWCTTASWIFPKIVTRRVALVQDASWTHACFISASRLTYPTTDVCVDTDLFSQAAFFFL